jgi:hypothetical protein
MSSHDSNDKTSKLGLYVILAIIVLVILMLCAMFFPGKTWMGDGNGRGAVRAAGEVI